MRLYRTPKARQALQKLFEISVATPSELTFHTVQYTSVNACSRQIYILDSAGANFGWNASSLVNFPFEFSKDQSGNQLTTITYDDIVASVQHYLEPPPGPSSTSAASGTSMAPANVAPQVTDTGSVSNQAWLGPPASGSTTTSHETTDFSDQMAALDWSGAVGMLADQLETHPLSDLSLPLDPFIFPSDSASPSASTLVPRTHSVPLPSTSVDQYGQFPPAAIPFSASANPGMAGGSTAGQHQVGTGNPEDDYGFELNELFKTYF